VVGALTSGLLVCKVAALALVTPDVDAFCVGCAAAALVVPDVVAFGGTGSALFTETFDGF